MLGGRATHRLVVEKSLHVGGQTQGCVVTPPSIFVQRFHHDPIELTSQHMTKLCRIRTLTLGRLGQLLRRILAEPSAWAHGFLFAYHATHLIEAGHQQLFTIEGGPTDQQFVEQHAQAVDVAARVNVEPAHFRLLGANISWRADELLEMRIDRLIREDTLHRLGNPKINHLGHRLTIVHRDEDIGWLDVAMNDSLLMSMLDGVTNRQK